MKYKGLILIILIIAAVSALIFLPEERLYKEIATVGSPAPEFELRDTNGTAWKLSSLRGKVVFINFWASWCATCNMEMPYRKSLFSKMQGRQFQMLGIIYKDDPSKAIAYIKRNGIVYPVLVSADDTVARAYGITGVPESFIIDKNGIIREKIVGPRQWDSPEAIEVIEKWMQTK